MVTRLYKMEKVDGNKEAYETHDDRSEFIYACPQSDPRDFFCDYLPKCF